MTYQERLSLRCATARSRPRHSATRPTYAQTSPSLVGNRARGQRQARRPAHAAHGHYVTQLAHCDSRHRDGETAPGRSTRSWAHVCWRRSLHATRTLLLLAGQAKSLHAARKRRPVRCLVGGRRADARGRAASARCVACSRRLGEQGPSQGAWTRLGGPHGELHRGRGTRCLRSAGRQRGRK
jgi:hypothetical protein